MCNLYRRVPQLRTHVQGTGYAEGSATYGDSTGILFVAKELKRYATRNTDNTSSVQQQPLRSALTCAILTNKLYVHRNSIMHAVSSYTHTALVSCSDAV
jgi:hypothetical protein